MLNIMNKSMFAKLGLAVVAVILVACASPEEKATAYYEKGMKLIESDPQKAKLEFQNALQIKKDLIPAIMGLATIAEKQSDWKGSFTLLNQVVLMDSKNAVAYTKLGQIYLAGAHNAKALEMCNRALSIDKNNAAALVLLGSIQLKDKNATDAVENANAAIKNDPKNQDAYALLAAERMLAKDPDAALNFLNHGIAINEKNLSLQLIKIKVLETLNKTAEVESTLKKLIDLYPKLELLRKNLAQFYHAQGKTAEAKNQLQKLIDINPTNLAAKIDMVRFVIGTEGAPQGRAMLEAMVKSEPDNYQLAFALVNLYKGQKDDKAALDLLNRIAAQSSSKDDGLKAKMMVATQMVQAGKLPEARNLINNVLSADSKNEEALMLQAGMLIDEKKFDEAINNLRAIVRDRPNSSQALFLIARTYELSGDNQLADENYAKALEVSKNASVYALPFAQSLANRSLLDRAEKVLESSYQVEPDNKQLIASLAQVKLSKNDLEGANKLADHAKSVSEMPQLSEQINGALLARKGDYSGSLAAFLRAHQAAPKEFQPVIGAVRVMLAAKRSQDALVYIDQVLKNNPDHFEAELLKGQVLAVSEDVPAVIKYYDGLVAKHSNNPAVYQQYALAMLRLKKIDQAKKYIDLGLAKLPNSFPLKVAKANVFELTKQHEEAIAIYEGLLKATPNSEIVMNNLASLLADYRTDADSLNRAYELAQKLKSKQSTSFLDTIAWTSYRVGKYDDAVSQLKTLVSTQPNNALYHYHLGKAYVGKRREELAKESLAKAIDLAKGQPSDFVADATEVLQKLNKK